MAERIKVFFASSSELKNEREKCIYITNKLRKAHEHLDIDPVLWEHDMTHSSFPGNSNIQDAITNSELKDSPVVVFLFHSKIGQYTREEFDYATANNKKVFIYFKAGFSPEQEHLQAYTELLQFKESLNSRLLYDSFKDEADFENKLFSNLNLFFSQQYRSSANATATALPAADIKTLMMQMMQEMKTQKNSDNDNAGKQLAELQEELKKMREQLFAVDEKAKAQHEKAKHELEEQLSEGKEGNESLIRALEEMEAGNYDVAEECLLNRVEELIDAERANGASNETVNDLAGALYQLGRTRELQFDYEGAFNYYKDASETVPEVAEYKYEMARMAVELEMWEEALQYYDQALPTLIEVLGENSFEVADIYLGMATCFSSLDNEEDNVIGYTEAALEILRILGAEESPSLILAYNDLALAYKTKEDTKAIKFGKKAIALSIKLYGKDNNVLPYYYQTLGNIYDQHGEYEKAIDLHSKALDIHLQNYTDDDPSVKSFYLSYASACRGLRAYDDAIEHYTLALAITKKYALEDGWAAKDIQQAIKEITKEKKDAGY